MPVNTAAAPPRFCSNCGTRLNEDARFCHSCGAPVSAALAPVPSSFQYSNALKWGLPAVALIVLVALSLVRIASRPGPAEPAAGEVTPLGAGAMRAPDISAMSPQERADRLFNRVMSLSSEGKADSAAFFAPMALAALEALAPLDAHLRYDMGMVALVAGDPARAAAQADTILAARPSHLLGLALAARAADARGNSAASRTFQQRLLAAEAAERALALPEYTDHDSDLRSAVEQARARR